MRRRADRRVVVLVVALGMLVAACGGGNSESTVNVKTVATDLTYGVPEPVKPAAPANLNPVPVAPLPTVKQPTTGPVERPVPPSDPCPTAPLTDFPDAATSDITDKPKAGEYRWKIDGDQQVPTVGEIALPQFSNRSVSDVTESAQGFTFAVTERELVFGSSFTVKTTYEVRKQPGALEDQQPAGLYLTRIERVHSSDSGSNSVFNPSPAVLLLPTPAVLGTAIESTGIDAASLEVMRNHGNISERKRVDACGKLVDTFFVLGFQEFIGGDGGLTRRLFRYGIATGMGGLPVIEHIESPCIEAEPGVCQEDAVTFKMDAHIAQLEPR